MCSLNCRSPEVILYKNKRIRPCTLGLSVQKVCDDLEVDERKSWTQKRSEIRSSSRVNDRVRTSLQPLDVLQVAKCLAGIAADSRSQHFRKSRRVLGMIHVLDELLAVDDLCSGKGKGVLPFEEAYDLFSSAFEAELTVADHTNFRDELLPSETELPVTVFTWNNMTYYCTQPRKVEYC